MLVLVTYDVNTETPAGRKRLRKVAKACVDHGQRVQNSVFECLLDAAQYTMFKAALTALIDPEADQPALLPAGQPVQNQGRACRPCAAMGAGRYFAGVKAPVQKRPPHRKSRCEPSARRKTPGGSHRGAQHF